MCNNTNLSFCTVYLNEEFTGKEVRNQVETLAHVLQSEVKALHSHWLKDNIQR